ncbi:MAG TPA: hypothetical protein VII40_04310 [Xanthobacteraceae bacterium]|jgi:hypothetical protein
MPGRLRFVVVVALGSGLAGYAAAAPALDYAFFKGKVEPIFLQKRPGHTRCYFCHAESNNGLHLEKLLPGHDTWTEEQSRKNFATVSNLVNPGEPGTSRLLLHPLAPEGGGDAFHSGGRQFADKNDPQWKAIEAWVNGAKADGK